MRRFYIVAAALAAGMPAGAYIRETTASSTPLAWSSPGNIQYQVDGSINGKMKDSFGQYTVVPGSDPVAAIQAALDTWNAVSVSRARFGPLQTDGSAPLGKMDNINTIGFANTNAARAAVSDSIAVTGVYFNTRTGEIVDADIILNPEYRFASKLAYSAFDLQGTITHELGHTLGADHSPLRSSTMFAYGGPETTLERTLTADELAFIAEAYPANPAEASAGVVKGQITCPAGFCDPVPSVLLFNSATGDLIQAIGRANGDYTIPRVPPGTYNVFVEPYIASYLTVDDVNPGWGAAIYGGAQSPQTVEVSGGNTAVVNLTANTPTLLTDVFFAGDLDITSCVHSGYTSSFTLFAKGSAKRFYSEDVMIFGGMKMKADSFDSFSLGNMSGVTFDIDVPSSTRRSTSVIAVRQGDAVMLAPGITVLADVPAALPSDIRNAASYDPGPIAPGELIALAGFRLGPVEGVGSDGALTSGIAVQVGGIDAPVLYAADGYLRVQVPYEIAGAESAVIQIRNGDAKAEAILAEVLPANPGVVFPILNEDGTPNGARTPAARGSVITIYGTGQGAVEPPVPTGQKAAADVKSLIPSAAVNIGRSAGEVKAAYMVPGVVGMFRLDVGIPKTAEAGSQMVTLTMGNVVVPVLNAITVR